MPSTRSRDRRSLSRAELANQSGASLRGHPGITREQAAELHEESGVSGIEA